MSQRPYRDPPPVVIEARPVSRPSNTWAEIREALGLLGFVFILVLCPPWGLWIMWTRAEGRKF